MFSLLVVSEGISKIDITFSKVFQLFFEKKKAVINAYNCYIVLYWVDLFSIFKYRWLVT